METKDLNKDNPHEKDEYVTFDEPTHTYYVDGKKIKYSVTQKLGKYFPFDRDGIANNLSKNNKYNKDSKYYGMSADDIRADWNKGSSAGTHLHAEIETYYNTYGEKEPENFSIEYSYFKNFVEDHPELVPYRTEWIVYSRKYDISGSIDMVYKNKDGSLSIYDWKRSKRIDKDSFRGDFCPPPLHVFQNCNFNKYSLQLNLYKWILENEYGFKVKDLCLVILHDSNPNYQLEPVDDLQNYIELVLKL